MKALLWFLLGGLTCFLAVLGYASNDDRNVEFELRLASRSGMANPNPNEVVLDAVQDGQPPRDEPSDVERESHRDASLSDVFALPLAPYRSAVPEKAFIDPPPSRYDRGRIAPPAPEPKWTQNPELAEYYENGQLHFRALQVQDENGKWLREGPWVAWHENGQVHEDGAYLRDREHGDWKWWYENGVPMAEGGFFEGERTGPWTFWHENGRVMVRGQYHAGQGTGTWIHYDVRGEPVKRVFFVGGEVESEEFF